MELSDITVNYLRSRLFYDRATGFLFWKGLPLTTPEAKRWNRRCANKRAGCIDKNGHRVISLAGGTYMASRLIWFMETGEYPTRYLRHKNRDTDDLRMDNLEPFRA